MKGTSSLTKRLAAWAAALALLLAVFALYLQPGTMIAVSEFVWSCFN